MARVTADEFVEKHARRLKGSIEDMRRGISKVSESPTDKAADKAEKMKMRLVAKIDDGTWASRLRSVSLEDWKSKMLNKGLPRVSGGIDAAHDKVKDFASQLLPAIDAAVSKVKSMPDLTLDDSINRMTSFTREMAKFRKK